MKRILAAALLAGSMTLATRAAAAESGVEPFLAAPSGPAPSGLSLSLGIGYGVPLGAATGVSGDAMNKIFSGTLPLQLDVGWRFSPNLYLGAYFDFSPAFVSSQLSTWEFGIDFLYTFTIQKSIVLPYAGLGVGYELASYTIKGVSSITGGSASETATATGWEFVRFIVGVDFRVANAFRVGPFVNFSLGEYTNLSTSGVTSSSGSISNKALHEWLQFGIKGTLDL
ncbi:MAG TPA: hypothetical protein VMT17_13515 [Anaeromyxobacteraceae bacterium]|nr:hypothetical protein [Anaeromyxobacteraceae bacterium]